ncbi:MAG TPA: hypothetical protein DCS55_12650 [Acidimicrobiaceae bacterium]|nr:hypothetical protein [Acidimicrobiaceae bacterium]
MEPLVSNSELMPTMPLPPTVNRSPTYMFCTAGRFSLPFGTASSPRTVTLWACGSEMTSFVPTETLPAKITVVALIAKLLAENPWFDVQSM